MADAAHPQDRSSRSGLWLAAALIALAALLGALNGLGRVDQILYDRAVVMTPRPASPDILIVAIDDATIDALGRWPWRRAIHAALLDRLQGARAVGLDVIFAEPDTINPNDDAILADSLRRNGRAVLPVVLDRLDHPGSMSLPIRRWPRPRGWASSTRASTPTAWCAKACCACTTTATGGAIWP